MAGADFGASALTARAGLAAAFPFLSLLIHSIEVFSVSIGYSISSERPLVVTGGVTVKLASGDIAQLAVLPLGRQAVQGVPFWRQRAHP